MFFSDNTYTHTHTHILYLYMLEFFSSGAFSSTLYFFSWHIIQSMISFNPGFKYCLWAQGYQIYVSWADLSLSSRSFHLSAHLAFQLGCLTSVSNLTCLNIALSERLCYSTLGNVDITICVAALAETESYAWRHIPLWNSLAQLNNKPQQSCL